MKVFSLILPVRILVILTVSLIPWHAFADPAQGYLWLSEQQNSDGGIYQDQDIALPEQSTSEVLEAVLLASAPAGIDRQSALASLEVEEHYTESLARRLLAGAALTVDGLDIASLLRQRQNRDGGFGHEPGGQSNALDTCWAIRALENAGQSDAPLRQRTVTYLLNSQEDNGAWSYDGQPSPYLTSCLVEQLVRYREQYSSVAGTIVNANSYLLGLLTDAYQAEENEAFITALSLSALSVSMAEVTSLEAVADSLKAAQLPSGSWENDVYVTALALRGLQRFEARRSADLETLGAISGRVVVAGSLEPIAGASTSLVGMDVSASSNLEGEFLLSKVPEGDQNLLVHKEGFEPVSVAVEGSPGEIQNLGVLGLVPLSDKATLAALIIDDETGAPVPGATVSLKGESSYTVKTGDTGAAAVTGILPGGYEVNISTPGYYDLQFSLNAEAGQNLRIKQGLLPLATVLDDSPGTLTGTVVDSESGDPVPDATVDVSGKKFVTNGDGHFAVTGVERGEYKLAISSPDFLTATYRLTFPPGSSGELGSLELHRSADNQPSEQLSLNVHVIDTLSQSPVVGAEVKVGGLTAITDIDGRAEVAGIGALEFQVDVRAQAYQPASYQVTASAFGSFNAKLALTPEVEPSSEVQISGYVRDQLGEPVAGARLEVMETGQVALSDELGSYSIPGIEPLAFTLNASAAGFQGSTIPVDLQQPGSYTLNVTLPDIPTDRFHISSIDVPSREITANDRVHITAAVRNLSLEAQSATIRAQVFSRDGEWVADLDALLPGTEQVAGSVHFPADETLVVEVPWNTVQSPAGIYDIVLTVLEPGSISRSLPGGVALASANASATISPSSELGGGITFNPSLAQFGSSMPVDLRVLVRNLGNQELPGGTYTLEVRNESGEQLLSRDFDLGALAVNGLAELQFGDWMPTEPGHLSIAIRHQEVPSAGEISAIYYVGDVASGEFVLEQRVLPEGDNEVGATINLLGVDNTQGSSTDPLLNEVREAVTKGGKYVGNNAVAWHSRHRCLGCHIQTQSLLGQASSLDKADIDLGQTTYLYNTIASSQQSDGSLRSSHSWTKTPTSLGLWSLSAWPDEKASFRTRYRAAEHLLGRRTNSGEQTYWTADHTTGWMAVSHEGITAIVAKSLVGLVESHRAGDIPQSDFRLGNPVSLSLGTRPAGMVGTTEGLLIAKRGGVERFDPVTGESSVVYADNSGRDFYDIALGPQGQIFVSGRSTVMRIAADGATSDLSPGSGQYTGIIYWNDGIYVTEPSARRIWRRDSSGQWSIFASGGLLVYPDGLAISHEGNLLVGNGRGAYNVLEFDADGNASVFADGFSYPPFRITPVSEGEYLVTTGIFSSSGLRTPNGLNLLRPDGTVERLFSSEGVNGSAVEDGQWYVTNTSTNSVQVVNRAPFDDALIDDIRAAAPRIANYFLARAGNNNSQTLYGAFRLVGLAELKKIIDDESTRMQIDATIDHLATELRGRQRADGGWGKYLGWGSDPLTTAWVGIALDYTNPSADDPMVRRTISYLLGAQAGRGDWWGRYFSTRLGTTSMVMAYMPQAIDRLGGLDVGLELLLPADVELSDPSLVPSVSDRSLGGESRYRWDLTGVTGRGQQIDFKLAIADLELGEQRPVAQSAIIEFANSFTEETIQRDLVIPTVTAASELGLTVATDKPAYPANEPVNITVPVANNGPAFTGGTLVVQVRTSIGQRPVAELESRPDVDLAAGQSGSYQFSWNTGWYQAGSYEIYSFIRGADGRLLTDGSTSLEIVNSDQEGNPGPHFGVKVAADQPVYAPWDEVVLDSRVANLTVNDSMQPVLAKLEVVDPNGEIRLSHSRVIPELAAGALRDFQQLLQLRDASAGEYMARLVLWDAQVEEQLAASEAKFLVGDDAQAHLEGSVQVAAQRVPQGDPQSCTDKLSNRSSTRTITTSVRQLLLRGDMQEELQSKTSEMSLLEQQEITLSRGVDTASLPLGQYVCVLQSIDGDSVRTLGYAGFTVVEPPIKISGNLGIGERGRLLALIDAPGPDPHGPGAPGMASQRDFLRALLDASGWSYTIVDNAKDFYQELENGGYTVYALLSEQVKLDKATQELLADNVAAGDGLLAGGHDRRNRFIEPALGIEVRGNSSKASGVSLHQSGLGDPAAHAFTVKGKVLTFVPAGAEVLGHYDAQTAGSRPPREAWRDQAVSAFTYASGHSVFTGFDLLANATARSAQLADAGDARPDSPDNAFGQLLLDGLGLVHPEVLLPRGHETLPLTLQVHNEKRATPGRALMLLSDGLVMVDPGEFSLQENGSWLTSFSMTEGESRTFTVYVQLPAAGAEEVGVVLQSGDDGEFEEQQALLFPITVQSLE